MSDASGFIRVNAIPDRRLRQFSSEDRSAWTRLEPAGADFGRPGARPQKTHIHDPLWLLARQWQLAEFEGEDVGTPLIVHMKTTELPVTAWQPGNPASDRPARAAVALGVPLDPLVENEPPVAEIGLRQRAEAGTYLVELLAEEGLDARLALVGACPLPVESGTEPVSANFQIIARQTPDVSPRRNSWKRALLPGSKTGRPRPRTAAERWLKWFRGNVAPLPRERADDSLDR